MKVYNAIGLQIAILGVVFMCLALVGRYYPNYFDIAIAMMVVGLIFAPSPYHEWREKEIRECK